ncbi:transposase [Candidatus Margulisiibacteriota bacterium]
MARKPRVLVSNSAYHVVARANRQEMIFKDDSFKDLLMETIKRAKKKYSFNIRNFCIMGNHIHFDIEPLDDTNLSKIMQWILSVFARRYNKYHNYKGHVWYDRFKSKVIRSMQQFLNTFKYIANNPVRALMVDHPLKYAYSGITCYQQNNLMGILDPPDKELETAINDFLAIYNPEKARQTDEKYSFRDKKPGRPKKK